MKRALPGLTIEELRRKVKALLHGSNKENVSAREI